MERNVAIWTEEGGSRGECPVHTYEVALLEHAHTCCASTALRLHKTVHVITRLEMEVLQRSLRTF